MTDSDDDDLDLRCDDDLQCGAVGDPADASTQVCVLRPGHDGPHRALDLTPRPVGERVYEQSEVAALLGVAEAAQALVSAVRSRRHGWTDCYEDGVKAVESALSAFDPSGFSRPVTARAAP